MLKKKYYSLKNILDKNAHYNIIIGERSNGKTYSVLKYAVERAVKMGEQLAIIRRWQDDFKQKRGATMFDALINNGELKKITNNEWTHIHFYSGRWYFARYENDVKITAETPFAYAFAISSMEHDKSTSYPAITTILFDEFLTRQNYLPDEFVLFMNVISTIVRDRNNVKIFMCGNTVNKYSPYFSEMGLTHIKEMKQGDIDVYRYGDSDLIVAVEFSDTPQRKKDSNVYFAFNNPKLSMITGQGSVWEMSIYPHKPVKFAPKHIIFTFFVLFNGDKLQCEIVSVESMTFIFVHRKTTDLQRPDKDLIFSPDYDPRPNWRRKITKPQLPIEKRIADLFMADKVFFQDNEIGEIMRNYLIWCNK